MIIAKNKNQLNYMKEHLEKANIDCSLISKKDWNFDGENIRLITMHSIKGLEFKVVFIIGINDGVIPYFSYRGIEEQDVQETIERKLLYVGMTSSGVQSKFISEINPKYLKINKNCKMNKFYKLSLDDFKFKNEIIDLYSTEEVVRQWVIREIIDTYKYTESLINVEYKINNFSRVGLADIAVNIYSNKNKIPYILIETKAFGKGLQNDVEQIKSTLITLTLNIIVNISLKEI